MTAKGKIVFTLLLLGVVGFGVWKWWDKLAPKHSASNPPVAQAGAAPSPAAAANDVQAPELAELETEVPGLPAPVAYQP